MMTEHVLKRFDEELTKLRHRLIKMGTLVQSQIEMSLKAVIDNNQEISKIVIAQEEKVNELDIKIDKQCMKIFALHQPVALDLRLVLSAFSMNDNFENIGDFAASISESFLKISIEPGLVKRFKFEKLSAALEELISIILDALINMSVEQAMDAVKFESRIDLLYEENLAIMIETMKAEPNLIEPCAYLIDINRNLQLIARQAKNIAQELVFVVEARSIKHRYLTGNEANKSEEIA